jgi:hypothetical protein
MSLLVVNSNSTTLNHLSSCELGMLHELFDVNIVSLDNVGSFLLKKKNKTAIDCNENNTP